MSHACSLYEGEYIKNRQGRNLRPCLFLIYSRHWEKADPH